MQLPAFIGFFPKELLRQYDIVSWDPRGSGASTAVQCFKSQAAESAFLGEYAFFPVGRGQQRAYISRWREFGKICAARTGALLKHVSTADSARDLNLLHQDLGQPKLNYLGISYGTSPAPCAWSEPDDRAAVVPRDWRPIHPENEAHDAG